MSACSDNNNVIDDFHVDDYVHDGLLGQLFGIIVVTKTGEYYTVRLQDNFQRLHTGVGFLCDDPFDRGRVFAEG